MGDVTKPASNKVDNIEVNSEIDNAETSTGIDIIKIEIKTIGDNELKEVERKVDIITSNKFKKTLILVSC